MIKLNKKTKEFYDNFCKKFPKESLLYKPISNFTFKHKPIFFETKYGIVKTLPKQILKGIFPGIKSAVEPTTYFINKSTEVHKGKYDYTLSNNIRGNPLIDIICKKHGLFRQDKSNHMNGKGCPTCALFRHRKPIDLLIKEFNNIHNNFYNYSKTKYNENNNKIIIICPSHGEFLQTFSSHLKGHGCQKCANEIKSIGRQYLYKKNTNQYTTLYIYKLYNNNEEFIKIGISKNIKIREKYYNKFYKTSLLYSKKYFLHEAYNIEQYLLNMLYKNSYTPLLKFIGNEECIKNVDIKNIKKLLNFKIKFYGLTEKTK